MLPRQMKEKQEADTLGRFSRLSQDSRGRRLPEEPCPVRTVFERDKGRIIYSMPFRRLRHKTQVFFNPRSDHICTRMEHVIYVNYISGIIGKALNLNNDLIEAIALGHDLGHAPFGHSGEKFLNDCLREHGADFEFKHELHSLRVIDVLTQHRPDYGLNLTFEVRDGIASHCGEAFHEYELFPNRQKQEADLIPGALKHEPPATLEACVVRMADKIAYVGRDIEDAARAGIMNFADLPAAITDELGATNSQMVNTLVMDIIENSYGEDHIKMSRTRGECLEELLQMNVEHIYLSPKIKRYEKMTETIVHGLFDSLLAAMKSQGAEALQHAQENALRALGHYLKDYPEPAAGPLRQITDYIAGMTDHYASATFNELFLI